MITNSNRPTPITVPVKRSQSNQVYKLVYRRLLTFYRDKRDLAITFGQAPILAIAFFFVFQNIVTVGEMSFFPPLREYLTPSTVSIIIFLAILTAVWFGSSKAIVEIPGSKILYQQERLSFLGNFNYLISIFIALSIITLGQVLLFSVTFYSLFVWLPAWFQPFETGLVIEKFTSTTLSTGLVVKEPVSVSFLTALMPKFLLQFVLLMWLIAVASIAVAMLISMFTHSRAAANAVLSFLLIVQILFAGSVIKPVIYMSPAIQTIANIMVSRWGFESAVLLFERDLNLLMPRQATNDNDFVSFNFSHGLRKLDTGRYIAQVAAKDVKDLNNNPATTKVWHDSLQTAADDLKYLSGDISEVETQYIDKLEAAHWDMEKLADLTIPPRLVASAREQFDSKYSKSIGTIVSIIDNGKILVEYSIWQDIVSAEPSLELFRRTVLFPIDQADLSTQEKDVWSERINAIPSLQLFRATINLHTTWIMLIILTIGMLTLGWIYFTLRRD